MHIHLLPDAHPSTSRCHRTSSLSLSLWFFPCCSPSPPKEEEGEEITANPAKGAGFVFISFPDELRKRREGSTWLLRRSRKQEAAVATASAPEKEVRDSQLLGGGRIGALQRPNLVCGPHVWHPWCYEATREKKTQRLRVLGEQSCNFYWLQK